MSTSSLRFRFGCNWSTFQKLTRCGCSFGMPPGSSRPARPSLPIRAPRGRAADASTFDRVVIMPASRSVSSLPVSTQLPSARTVPGLAPVQGAPIRTIPNANVNLADRVLGADLDDLREILPQPLQSGGPQQAASPNGQDDSRPFAAPRPGMTVTTTEEQAPVFIRRPVRPQTGDPNR